MLSVLWYTGLFLTVYRKDAISFFNGSAFHGSASLRTATDHGDVENFRENTEIEKELMGKSALPEGLEMVSTSALSFSTVDSSVYLEENSRADQLGLIPDVLQELKEVFQVLAKEDGTKKDFISLLGLITEKYGMIGSHPNISKINEFIREQAPFAISNEELENLWD